MLKEEEEEAGVRFPVPVLASPSIILHRIITHSQARPHLLSIHASVHPSIPLRGAHAAEKAPTADIFGGHCGVAHMTRGACRS